MKDQWHYERHRPEQSLLYQTVERYYPDFLEQLAGQGKSIPRYVQREFEDYLKCGRLEHGFLRVRCEDCHSERLVAFSCKRRGFCPSCGARRMVESAALLIDDVLPRLPMRQWVLSVPFQLRYLFASQPQAMGKVLGIVYRAIETHLIHQAGQTRNTARTGAVTLIQRFGSALNLNIHFHMLFLDGVCIADHQPLVFRRTKVPAPEVLDRLIQTISHRIGRYLERTGLLVRDVENSYLQLDAVDESAMDDLLGHSITYRIAFGPQAGRKAFTLQTVPAREEESNNPRLAKVNGFSLHAGVAAQAHQRSKLERLCRYISRPAVSTERMALTNQGNIRYTLKTPYRDGTTHIILEPLDFMARLAALIPKPRVNLTRFHGVFVRGGLPPNSALRKQITPKARCKPTAESDDLKSPAQRRAAMSWAQRLKRVFNIDIETCSQCGGIVKVIACIEDSTVIKKILEHLDHHTESVKRTPHPARAPPAPT
ncbi:MAG: IS91 family transposase [Arenicellales bacterium]